MGMTCKGRCARSPCVAWVLRQGVGVGTEDPTVWTGPREDVPGGPRALRVLCQTESNGPRVWLVPWAPGVGPGA